MPEKYTSKVFEVSVNGIPKNELLIDAVTSSNALVCMSIPKISEEPEHTPLGSANS
jgi:hypothetical protein